MQALDNVRVLDLTQHIAGPYATRLFADLGADVIKIERPGGDVARQLGPFKGGVPGPERSGLFYCLNYNKRSVMLDLRTEAGKEALAALTMRADVVVESFAPAALDKLGCGWDFFHRLKPELPLISISNYGQTGPYKDYLLSELVLYAYAGEMHSMGEPDREPMKMAGTAALFESGSAVAPAIFGALYAAKRHGIGQHVDIALTETQFGGVDRRHATAIAYQFSGRKTHRVASAGGGMPQGIYQCADGYVDFTNSAGRKDRISDMIGHPDWFQEERFTDPVQRLNPEVIDEFNAYFMVWCLERTKREIWAEARRARVLCGPLFTMEDLFNDDNFKNRGFWEKTEHPVMGEVTIPGRPFIMEKGGWAFRRPAPLLGQHTEEVLKEAGVSAATISSVLKGAKA